MKKFYTLFIIQDLRKITKFHLFGRIRCGWKPHLPGKCVSPIILFNMKYILVAIALVGIAVLTGCSETEESATLVLDDKMLETAGAVKMPEEVAAAPQMPGVGTPSVTEVGFYYDWKLTKPITGPVETGQKVFIKVAFSEPMQHVVSDVGNARPILYYRRVGENQKLARFKVAAHGASGKDFANGDAKPLHDGTDDYICKYVISQEDAGKEIAIMVGKNNTDLEGNTLAKFYRHPEVLQVDQPAVATVMPELAEEPITQEYLGGFAVADLLPESAWVLDFPGPYREYTPPKSSPRDFVGRVCMEVTGDMSKEWAAEDYIAPVASAIVTITKGPRRGEQVTTNKGGYYLFPNVAGDNLYLRVERAYLEPKEVVVYRTRRTGPQRLRPNEVLHTARQNLERQENAPGIILVGLRWPDAVRFIIENELLPHDLTCTIGVESPPTRAGSYGGGELSIINPPEYRNNLTYGTFFHELGHARQHAVAIMHGVDNGPSGFDWENTPEGKAYERAWAKDLKEIPSDHWLSLDEGDYFSSSSRESAAEFCALYWGLEIGNDAWDFWATWGGGIEKRAPNRYKWAEKHLNKQYD